MPKQKPKTKSGKREKAGKVMREYDKGELHSGSKSGPKVTNPKQAKAIAMSESGQSKNGTKPSHPSKKSFAAREKRLEGKPI